MRCPLAVCLVAVLLICSASAKKSKKSPLTQATATKQTVPAVPVASGFAPVPAAAPLDAAATAPFSPQAPQATPEGAPAAPQGIPEGAPATQEAAQNEGSDAHLTPDQQAAKQAPAAAPASPIPAAGETASFSSDNNADSTGNSTTPAVNAPAVEEKEKKVENVKVPKKISAKATDDVTPEHTASALEDEKVTYPSIIKKALIGLQGLGKASTKDIMDVLEKHFFTGKKEESVWPLALEESESKLGLEFDERQLFDMQMTIKNVYRKLLECELPSLTTDNKAECIVGVLEFIDDGLQTFGMLRMNDQDQAKMMQFNLAFKVMAINVLQIVKNVAEKGKVNDLKAIKYLLDIGEDMYDGLKPWTDNTINWRLDAVDQPQVCNVQQVMWEEFTVGCVYRYPSTPAKKKTKRDLGSYAGIGGIKENYRRYKAKVVDKVTGEEIFSQTESTDAKNNKESVIAKLLKGANESRNKYIQVMKDDLQKFYGERTGQVLKEITKLWEKKKAKLQGMREQIKNKHLI